MGRPRKNKTVVEVAPEEQIQQTSFKIKLTNLRTATYPDALVETDFQKFKVGDLLVKGVSKNTVYEIVNIFRGDIFTCEGDLESKLAGNLEAMNKRNAIGKQIDILKNLKGLTNKTQKEVEEQTTVAVTL